MKKRMMMVVLVLLLVGALFPAQAFAAAAPRHVAAALLQEAPAAADDALPQSQGIKLNVSSRILKKGAKVTLVASAAPAGGKVSNVRWSSNKPSVASVNQKGKVLAKKNGTATITAKTPNGQKATCKIRVGIAPKSIKLSEKSVTIEVKKTLTLAHSFTPGTTTLKTVTWSSSNTGVATVSGGKITAKAPGTAKITAKAVNGKKAVCMVEVIQSPKSIKLVEAPQTLGVGEKFTLKVKFSPSTVTEKKVTYTSSNPSVATVSAAGKITAKNTGAVTITAATANGKTAACSVTVTQWTERSVYNKLMAQKTAYPEGKPWFNCYTFAGLMQQAAFGQGHVPREHKDFGNLRVGDHVRIDNGMGGEHSVVVLDVTDGVVTVVEGNYNSSVHWGRTITVKELKNKIGLWVSTYWPAS